MIFRRGLLEEFKLWGHGKNIAYITSYKNTRELGKLADSENITASVFNSPEFGIPLDALKTPFLFVLDKNGKATNFFAVSKSHPHLLRDYLTSLKP